jgi:type IV pilus assembly protein PilA
MARALQSRFDVGKGGTQGFTLIEMMIVVVIVGVLATLAVVGYRKIIQTSHVSEATGMVQNIRVAQEAYRSETQQYASVSADYTNLCPAAPSYGVMTGWDGTCGSGTVKWSVLPLHVDGPVLFGYGTTAGTAGTAPVSPITYGTTSSLTLPASVPTDWFVAWGAADLDGDTTNGTLVVGSSWTNQISVLNEGQ